ncbi:MAG TPA: nucleotidyltransferase family protein [Elusimicrobiota bacterium]|nr:nucleotidyltransferase family protein [Elusimicrobiota bacterium]
MKAVILAAGMGTRLAPLTQETPKALVKVGDKTMLEIVLRRLAAAGTDAFAVNAFHLADKIARFLEERANFGLDIKLSREETLLNTGGGLKKAAPLVADGRPFFIHNVDVLSDIDLSALYQSHLKSGALATLAVQRRASSRPLLFGSDGRLLGRGRQRISLRRPRRSASGLDRAAPLAFCGVSVASPELLSRMTESGAFSLSDAYVRIAAAGGDIRAFRCDDAYWQDVGTPEKLEQARKHLGR